MTYVHMETYSAMTVAMAGPKIPRRATAAARTAAAQMSQGIDASMTVLSLAESVQNIYAADIKKV
jgi:predicted peroxiredoxin